MPEQDLHEAEAGPPPDEQDPLEAPANRLPRLPLPPRFRTPTPGPPPAPDTPPEPTTPPPLPPAANGERDSATSSPGSTSRPEPDWVDPKDFRDAVRQAADMGFVLAGQGIGRLHARRSGEPDDRGRWLPSPSERKRFADPAHRIARRHITASKDAADALDVALMAGATGAWFARAAFDLDTLEDIE